MTVGQEIKSFLDGLKEPRVVQQECLMRKVVQPNTECEFGRAHNFGSIRTPAEYQRAVPRVDYEDVRSFVDRMTCGEQGVLVTEPVRRFFLTSGSTAEPKYIPVTGSFIRDKVRAFSIYWGLIFQQRPGVRRGKIVTNFADCGSTSSTVGGIACSSESAFWGAWEAKLRTGRRSLLPKEVATISDSDCRLYAIARLLMEQADLSVIMTLNPSTIVLLLKKIDDCVDDLIEDVRRGGLLKTVDVPKAFREYLETTLPGNQERAEGLRSVVRPNGPRLLAADVWPQLELVICWRSPMLQPYHRLLEAHLRSVSGRDYITMASEGIIAIPLEDNTSGGVLATNTHFYEFIPEEQAEQPNPDVLLAHELEVDRSYVLLLSTSSGLYRYDIGDVVRVTGFEAATPIVEFLYRVGATCSLTGEKLTEEQVVQAFEAAASHLEITADWFTLFPANEPLPHYVILVEPASGGNDRGVSSLGLEVDRQLARCNTEYRAKRDSQRLAPPEVWIAAPGSYASWHQSRIDDGANDGQIKPIHLTRDSRFGDRFRILERCDAS